MLLRCYILFPVYLIQVSNLNEVKNLIAIITIGNHCIPLKLKLQGNIEDGKK